MSIPLVKVKRISIDRGSSTADSMQIDINFCTIPSGLSFDKNFATRYTVDVIQCTSQDIAEELKKESQHSLKNTISKLRNSAFLNFRSFHINPSQLRNYKRHLSDPKRRAERPEICWKSLNPPFTIGQKKLSHLSYIFIPSLNDGNSHRNIGTPTIEVVIENGALVGTGVVFYKPDGQVYTGTPNYITQHGVKEDMPHGDGQPLSIVPVVNTTIQHVGILKDITAVRVNLSPAPVLSPVPSTTLKPSAARTAFGKQQHRLPPSTKKQSSIPIISELWLTKVDDAEQSNRFAFAVDFRKLIEEHTRYPGIAKNSENFDINKLARIKEINVIRRSVPANPNHIGDSEIEYIASIKNQGDKLPENVLRKKSSAQEEEIIGSLKEIKILQHDKNLRYITGTDTKINSLSGKYQYGVELVAEDLTADFVKSGINKVKNAARIFSIYGTIAAGRDPTTRRPYYNSTTSTFVPKFSAALAKSTISNKGIDGAITDFVIEFSRVTKKPTNVNDYISRIRRLVDPVTGTLDNIMKVTRTIQKFASSLENFTGTKNRNEMTSGESPSGTVSSQTDSRRIEIKHWFREIYDPGFSKGNGYEFLPIRIPSSPTGLSSISVQNYDRLITAQHNKIFKTGIEKAPIRTSSRPDQGVSPQGSSVSADLRNTKATYLSPLTLRMNDKYSSFVPDDPEFYNIERYNADFVDVINRNVGSSATGLVTSNVRDKLIELYGLPGTGLSIITDRTAADDACSTSPEAESVRVIDEKEPAPKDISGRERDELAEEPWATTSSALFKLLSIFMSENNASWFGKDLREGILNYNNKDNILARLRTTQAFQELPNHIKALVSIATNEEVAQTALNLDLCRLGGDPKMNQAWYYENFMNLVEVQVLTGFNAGSIRSPSFRKLTQSDLNSIPRNEVRIARMKRYVKNCSGVSNTQELKTPIYNEYFLLVGGASTEASAASKTEPRRQQSSLRTVNNSANIHTSRDYAGLHTAAGTPTSKAERRRKVTRGKPTKQVKVAKSASKAQTAKAPAAATVSVSGPTMTGGNY
tara:strand:- start:38 stop:3157 length:3120 start_codon:yes stop_codon:yes gene_type:complete